MDRAQCVRIQVSCDTFLVTFPRADGFFSGENLETHSVNGFSFVFFADVRGYESGITLMLLERRQITFDMQTSISRAS